MVRGKSFQPSMKVPYYSTYMRIVFDVSKEIGMVRLWNNAFFVSSKIAESERTSNDPANSFEGPIWVQIVDS